jgi:hypothetical protein
MATHYQVCGLIDASRRSRINVYTPELLLIALLLGHFPGPWPARMMTIKMAANAGSATLRIFS